MDTGEPALEHPGNCDNSNQSLRYTKERVWSKRALPALWSTTIWRHGRTRSIQIRRQNFGEVLVVFRGPHATKLKQQLRFIERRLLLLAHMPERIADSTWAKRGVGTVLIKRHTNCRLVKRAYCTAREVVNLREEAVLRLLAYD